ncbi:MAG: heavy-metal-associated domain-containing protein [Euryarchaeota archaeon]|nr:heavy-metal-associated domain-containing protein [Euryarchaeota archaeon]
MSGMSCEGCEQNVVDSLEELGGVNGASADNETGVVRIEGEASDEKLRAAIEEAGYEVNG